MSKTSHSQLVPRSLFAAVGLLFLLVPIASARADGVIAIQPHYATGKAPKKAVGFRYAMRVEKNESNRSKILFCARSFYTPGEKSEFYQIETNFFSHWIQNEKDRGLSKWANKGRFVHGQAGLNISIPDYPKKGHIGLRRVDAQTRKLFPRYTAAIDAIPGLSKINVWAQIDMNGKDVKFEWSRGKTFTQPLSGWGERIDQTDKVSAKKELPGGIKYRIWKLKVAFDRKEYGFEFAIPATGSKYLAPQRLITLNTEFFEFPQLFQAYLWDVEVKEEGSDAWKPVRQWKLTHHKGHKTHKGRFKGYGIKTAVVKDKPAIEFSNDGTDTYLQPDDVIELGASHKNESKKVDAGSEEKEIESAIRDLGSGDRKVWSKAMQRLEKAGDAAVPRLKAVIASGTKSAAFRAKLVLMRIVSARAPGSQKKSE